jgi:hypothetical protein
MKVLPGAAAFLDSLPDPGDAVAILKEAADKVLAGIRREGGGDGRVGVRVGTQRLLVYACALSFVPEGGGEPVVCLLLTPEDASGPELPETVRQRLLDLLKQPDLFPEANG